jgi:HPt (histidine-containing phosphotransfer) domain-containing protein
MNASAEDRRGRPPVVPAVLASLRREVGEDAFRSLVRTYIDLLVVRLARIENAIGRRDFTDALDTVRDLRIGSAMLGAEDLAGLAAETERSLRRGEADAAAVRLTGLRSEAAAVIATLLMTNGKRNDPHPPDWLDSADPL